MTPLILYLAPEHWGEAEAECSATHQSPINFDPQSIEGGSDLEAIDLSDSYDDAVNGKLLNNGHTSEIYPNNYNGWDEI